MTVTAKGEPNTTGTIIVYGNNTTMSCLLTFDSSGNAQLSIDKIINNDVPYPGDSNKPIRLEFEDYHDKLENPMKTSRSTVLTTAIQTVNMVTVR